MRVLFSRGTMASSAHRRAGASTSIRRERGGATSVLWHASPEDACLIYRLRRGSACAHFQLRGLEMVGVDISPLAIQVARERGLRHARAVRIVISFESSVTDRTRRATLHR